MAMTVYGQNEQIIALLQRQVELLEQLLQKVNEQPPVD
jgi:hypothetical protein